MSAKKKTVSVEPAEGFEPVDQVEVVVEPVLPSGLEAIRALDGDSYLSIAERFGLNAHELCELNACAPVRAGSRILLR